MKGTLRRILGYLWAPTAFLAIATALPAHAALDDDRGKIIIEMEGGKSEARWVDGSLGTQPPAEATQLLGQANPCSLVTTPDLLSFTPNDGSVGAKFDSIGVDLLGGNGTGCSSTDENRGDQEALTIALVPEVGDLRVKLWILELELKGRSVEFQIEIFNGAGDEPVETYIVQGGRAAGDGRFPLDYGSDETWRDLWNLNGGDPNDPILIDCFENTDVNPDSRDTCVVVLETIGDRMVGTALDGSVALEGGKSTPLSGPLNWGGSDDLTVVDQEALPTSQVYEGTYTQLWLTEAQGELDCGESTITAFNFDSGAFGILRRLENADGCTASCEAIPYSLNWADDELIFTADYLIDPDVVGDTGQTCAAFAFTVNAAPIGLSPTTPFDILRPPGAVETPPPNLGDPEFGDTVTGQIPLEITQQFLADDPEYYLDTCEGTPIYDENGDLFGLDILSSRLAEGAPLDMSGLIGAQYGCWLNIRFRYGVDSDDPPDGLGEPDELRLEVDGYLQGDWRVRYR